MYDGPLNWPYAKASPATYRVANIVAIILEGWQVNGLQLEALTKRTASGLDEHRRLVMGQPLAEPWQYQSLRNLAAIFLCTKRRRSTAPSDFVVTDLFSPLLPSARHCTRQLFELEPFGCRPSRIAS